MFTDARMGRIAFFLFIKHVIENKEREGLGMGLPLSPTFAFFFFFF